MRCFNEHELLPQLCMLERESQARYYIGVDACDGVNSYCLGYKTPSDFFQVVLVKNSTDLASFNEEVANLAKYFDAEIIREGE